MNDDRKLIRKIMTRRLSPAPRRSIPVKTSNNDRHDEPIPVGLNKNNQKSRTAIFQRYWAQQKPFNPTKKHPAKTGCRRFKSCQPDNESNVLRNRIDCGGHLVIYAIASVLNDGADNAGDDGHNQRSDYGPPESIDGYSHVEQAYGQPRRKLHEQPVDDQRDQSERENRKWQCDGVHDRFDRRVDQRKE